MASQIRVNIEGFRSVGRADIIIDGITVVAGENGSGKSTISKLLYHLYKTTSDFDELVLRELQLRLKDVFRFLDILQHELYTVIKDRNIREEIRKDLLILRRKSDNSPDIQLNKWISIINKMAYFYSFQQDLFEEDKRIKTSTRNFRLKQIMRDVLKISTFDENENSPLNLDQISNFVESLFKEADGKIKSRPTSLFIESLRSIFSSDELPDVFYVLEYEEEIISLTKNYLSIPYSIQNVIYIDTPMMLGEEDSDNPHWDDLNELLSKSSKVDISKISGSISRDIIHGEISINDGSDFGRDFIYKRDDGHTYDLLDCATGVKSFGIIQLLLKNGSLTDKTLLIIDEPESHLHPQWIIEYARLIVMLHKIIGVKFFIASHNPDMVSAIKYISEKEAIDKNLNYYIAKKREMIYLYDYKHLKTDIDPIFESFNIALERIHQYGA
ncbi:MAG: AAA family ATPase [Saprospiraceae bacterium]|uniref:AAA family ATPase n=1 Tax=Candidatus Opimibacter skivensis TaxID=2982028 RepID=A0A9D7SVF1_9BACT|nr:AAA family ATPase [Candidatus Opimibacter skivensis]